MSTIEKAAARLVSKPRVTPPAKDDSNKRPGSETGSGDFDESVVLREGGVPHPQSPGRDTIKTCELDFPWLEKNGFLVPGHDNPKQAREFRRIKRPLLLNMQPAIAREMPLPMNTIFITSALPGEGKTFVSLNLALSVAAELDKSVLLIDGDAAKGDLSRWMGIYGEPGLVDLLLNRQAHGEGAVIDTNVERLQVMPCGKPVDHLDELYASGLMESLISGLARHDPDRVLIIDGPPLIATTEAGVLARRFGQTVMVVEANKTLQSAVESAAAQLEGCQAVSLLLNKSTSSDAGDYGYGYGYGSDTEYRRQASHANNDEGEARSA